MATSSAFIVFKKATTQQLDVALSSLPHTNSVLRQPIPVLRISLVSGQAESLVELQECSAGHSSSGALLMLGGQVVEAKTHLKVARGTTLTGLPYWFHIRGDMDQIPSSSTAAVHSDTDALSTFREDSPCNQSVFILKEPLEVTEDENLGLTVLWREGVFSAALDRCQLSDAGD